MPSPWSPTGTRPSASPRDSRASRTATPRVQMRHVCLIAVRVNNCGTLPKHTGCHSVPSNITSVEPSPNNQGDRLCVVRQGPRAVPMNSPTKPVVLIVDSEADASDTQSFKPIDRTVGEPSGLQFPTGRIIGGDDRDQVARNCIDFEHPQRPHLVVAASGAWIIDAKLRRGLIEIRDLWGLVQSRSSALRWR